MDSLLGAAEWVIDLSNQSQKVQPMSQVQWRWTVAFGF
jgi:hypothetical protein